MDQKISVSLVIKVIFFLCSILAVLRTLKAMYPDASIHGHRDFSSKACPSYDATSEYADL